MRNKFLVETICIMFIVLFVYAAVSKLLDYESFVHQIRTSPLLKDRPSSYFLSRHTAWLLPVIELLVAVILIPEAIRVKGLYLATMLMSIFTIYIIYIVTYSPFVPCSCGGVINKLTWTQHLWFNLGFILIGAVAIRMNRTYRKPYNVQQQ